jgi:hypothetical protein
MTKEDADYCIAKALATGLLDSAGGLNFHMHGSREEIVDDIIERAEAWNQPITRAEAERLTDKAIRGIWTRRILKWSFGVSSY